MKRSIPRRLFLKGAGSVLIGLPLLEESFMGKAHAAALDIPMRLLTMSFGLGLSRELQAEKANGALEPLYRGNLASKGCFFSELTNGHLESGGTVHFRAGATQFTGKKALQSGGDYIAGGPSLEQLCRNHFDPSGPSTVSSGIWSRTGATAQYVRHWNNSGSPGDLPTRRPSVVFNRIFGSFKPEVSSTSSDNAIDQQLNSSVLDTVLEQYNALTGENSYLGQASKNKLEEHFDSIRSVEMQLRQADQAVMSMATQEICATPHQSQFLDPNGFSFYDARSGGTDGGSPRVDWQVAQNVFRLMGRLYTLGFSCNALRFASMVFYGSGGHIRFSGDYTSPNGRLNFTNEFQNQSPHHGIFHSYQPDKIRIYQHYCISQLAYVLEEMDKVIEPNEQTMLDNSCVVLGTEYGENHNSDGIFGACFGGFGKFRYGQYDGTIGFDDFYRQIMDAYGVSHSIGQTIDDNNGRFII